MTACLHQGESYAGVSLPSPVVDPGPATRHRNDSSQPDGPARPAGATRRRECGRSQGVGALDNFLRDPFTSLVDLPPDRGFDLGEFPDDLVLVGSAQHRTYPIGSVCFADRPVPARYATSFLIRSNSSFVISPRA